MAQTFLPALTKENVGSLSQLIVGHGVTLQKT